MKIADERHIHPHLGKAVADIGHSARGFIAVNGDAHQFRASARQSGHLPCGGFNIGSVGIGHALHDDRCAAADFYTTNIYALRYQAAGGRGFNQSLCKISHNLSHCCAYR